jgi:hypothetical protein
MRQLNVLCRLWLLVGLMRVCLPLCCLCFCSCRHLQRNPDNQLYPLFEYFENWCQDENRHGDFFTAILKVGLLAG